MKRYLIACIFINFFCFTTVIAEESSSKYNREIVEQNSILINLYNLHTGAYPNQEKWSRELVDYLNKAGKYDESDMNISLHNFKDSYGNDLIYFFPPKFGDAKYNLYSVGKNGIDEQGRGDDVSAWSIEQDSDKNLVIMYVAIFLLCIVMMFLYKKRRKVNGGN